MSSALAISDDLDAKSYKRITIVNNVEVRKRNKILDGSVKLLKIRSC